MRTQVGPARTRDRSRTLKRFSAGEAGEKGMMGAQLTGLNHRFCLDK
jgi:hypothetical protein